MKLGKIKATYVDHMGSDERVVDAARVSFAKASDNFTEKQNKNLIQFLARGCTSGEWNANISLLAAEGIERDEVERILNWAKNMPTHFTPFTHPQITMVEKVPIFLSRQRFKHGIGFTYNEVSRRYVDEEPEIYTPSEWRSRPDGSVKQGSGEVHKSSSNLCVGYEHHMAQLILDYNSMIAGGVAPEQARMILPQSMMTEDYVTGSLYAWANAYIQRSDGHAQKEIQELAAQWDEIIAPLYPVSWAALTRGDY